MAPSISSRYSPRGWRRPYMERIFDPEGFVPDREYRVCYTKSYSYLTRGNLLSDLQDLHPRSCYL